MFIGINLKYLPSNSHAVASVVANAGADVDKWPGTVRCQKGPAILVVDLQIMVKERMQRWMDTKRAGPSRIVVYRSGVSDSQYQKVLDEEFPKIQNARDTTYAGNVQPKITMIVVSNSQKRRFDPEGNDRAVAHREEHEKAIANGTKPEGTKISKLEPIVRSGTVIERIGQTAQGTGAWDFFLQSHFANSGTVSTPPSLRYYLLTCSKAKPTHYIVIKEEKKVRVP